MKTLLLVLVLFAVASVPSVSASPSWLNAGAYVQYNQVFQWSGANKTTPMTWNITGVSSGLASLSTASSSFNVTDGRVIMYPVESQWKVNTQTREIVKVISGVNVTGYMTPFWINSDVKAESMIDAYFGTYAQVQKTETIKALGQMKSCWKVTLEWPTATMQRWYDKSTGIVLRIDTSMLEGGIQMNVTETATKSNIQILVGTAGTSSINPLLVYLSAALLVAGIALVSWVYFHERQKKQGLLEASSPTQ